MQSPADFDGTSALYGLVGAFTLYRLVRNRSSFFDEVVTDKDINLAWLAAIFLLTPVAVLAHEGGHYYAAKYFGATGIELHHRGYWVFVTYNAGPSFDTGKELIVSAAGPGVSVLLGFLSLALAVELPVRKVFKHMLAFFGVVGVFHTLIGYPLIDLSSALEGDFHQIYSLLPTSGRLIAGLIHVFLLGLLVLSWKRPPTHDLLVGYSRHG